MGPGGPHGGHRKGGTGADVELRPVPRAGDLVVAKFAVGERTAVVCTDVVDGVEHAADVKQRDHVAADLDERLARIRNLGDIGDADELCHQWAHAIL